jgi:2-polyprenyl-3-methyl-5-hydroxy-6-metoxy-1,4-benzoquinol methylase
MQVNKFDFHRWKYPFVIDGANTLDPSNPVDSKVLRRVEFRKQLFMDALLRSGFLRGKRVLDLGCNSGYWTYLAAKEGDAAYVEGVEMTGSLVRQARFALSRSGVDAERYRIIQGDAYKRLAQSEAAFDVIFCLGFFYHINDPALLMSLMSKACTGYVVLDTVIHPSDDATISVRPVKRNKADASSISLEFVSSPKAIYWMAQNAGFNTIRSLTTAVDPANMPRDYQRGHRKAFVLSKGTSVEAIWSNSEREGFLTPREDFERYGYYPEIKGGRSSGPKTVKSRPWLREGRNSSAADPSAR